MHNFAKRTRWNIIVSHSQDTGFSQNLAAFACLDQALVAPFGILAEQVRSFSEGDKSVDLRVAFATATKTVSRLFVYFGPHWLAQEAPSEQKEQIDRLSHGMILGFDILVTEMSRQFGFLSGCFGLTKEDIVAAEKCDWRTVQTNFAVDLAERVMTEWKMVKTKVDPGQKEE